jgi:PAS domain S-box-containing protein
MPNLYTLNQCEGCQFLPYREDPVLAHLLERISELEEENHNLRNLEETIRRNGHLFDVLLRGSQEAILLLNPELSIVRLIHSTLGYSEHELRGQPLLAFVHPKDAPRVEDYCFSLLNGRDPGCIEMRGLSAAGQWIWLTGHFTDMLDDAQVQAIVVNLWRADKPPEPVLSKA